MYYDIIKKTGLLIMILAFGSCRREFLEVVPKGKLIAHKTADYDLFMNTIQTFISSETLTYLGDEVAALEPYYSSVSPVIRRKIDWQDDFYDDGQVGEEMSGFMPVLYALNKVISEVMESKGGTEAQKLSLLSEARASRAWLYFYLINLYGKPYDAQTAMNDPGFPIMAKADVTVQQFTRNSVQEVYDFVVRDLVESISHLPEQLTYRARMSKPAAQAILGKVYVFMRKFQEADAEFREVFQMLDAGVGLPVALYDYRVATEPGGPLQTQPMMGPMQPVPQLHEEVLFVRQQLNVSAGQFGNNVVLRPEAAALYTSGDLRFLKFYATGPMGAPPAGDFRVVPRVYRRLGGDVNMGVYLPDVYLLHAEAQARIGQLDNAIASLEILRRHRMPVAEATVPSEISQTDLIKFIIDERIREFAVQGYRWFDMRRLSVDPIFSGQIYNRVVYNADGSVKNQFTLRPERLTLRLPQRTIEENPGMPNNP